jgi:monoamine oxidase
MTGASEPEVVIVGAGAAGIGAGLALSRLGVPFVILEAKDRVGGRAHTDGTSLGHLWDRGCHWFHSADRNPLRAIADRLGH